MTRYHRQEILPQIGPQGQRRLRQARVLIAGCGALGCVAAELLVRGGVGFLRIVDRDLVELTNLQRQLLYSQRDAEEEMPKAIAAARRLREINPEIEIDPVVADIGRINIEKFTDVDLILDGTDNVATRYLINDIAVRDNVPWVYAGCVGAEGRVFPIWPGQTACLRCIYPDPPPATSLPTCDTAGVLGPAAAVVGGLQAAMAIRFLVEGVEAAAASAVLVTLDAWTLSSRRLESANTPDPECPCCAQRKYSFLSADGADFTTSLCGRGAVQVLRTVSASPIDLDLIANRWQSVGIIHRSPWFVKCKLHDPAGIELTLFPDGRLLVHGITDSLRAKSLYSRFVGD